MAAVPDQAQLAGCVDCDPQWEDAMQLATGTSDHGAKRNTFVDLVGHEIGVCAGGRVIAELVPGWRPHGRVPLARGESQSLFMTDNVRVHTRPIWRMVAIQ